MDIEKALHHRWRKLWKEIGVRGHERELAANFRDLVKHYSGEKRFYHNLEHIHLSILELDKLHRFADDVDALELALFYHNVWYDPHARNNEEESVHLMQRHTGNLPMPESLRRITESLILATKHPRGIVRTLPDETLISDIDLTIFGAPEPVYDAYARAIRQEYSHLDANTYARGRAMVLQKFLEHRCIDGTWIYYHHRFRKRYEFRARHNLSRELARYASAL